MSVFKHAFLFPIAMVAGLIATPAFAQEDMDLCTQTLTGCELQLVQTMADPCVELIFDAPIEASEPESCYTLSLQIKNSCFGDVHVSFGEQFPIPTVIGLGETLRLEPLLDADTQSVTWDVQVLDGMDILDEAASGTIEFEIGFLYTQDPLCEEPIDEEPIDEEPIDEEPIDEESNTPTGEREDAGSDSGCSATGKSSNSSSIVLVLVFSFFALLRRRLL